MNELKIFAYFWEILGLAVIKMAYDMLERQARCSACLIKKNCVITLQREFKLTIILPSKAKYNHDQTQK
jgi:hypothetical protein